MKVLILAIFAFVLALANAALVRRSAEDDFSLLAREVDKSNAHMVFGTLPDGRRRVSLYEDGQFLGAIEEGPGGGDNATAYDAYGQVMEIDDDDDENDSEDADEEDGEKVHKLYPRQRLTIIRRLWRFIRRYGQKAWVSHILSLLGKLHFV